MAQLLTMLKTDLGIMSTSAYDLRLEQYLKQAAKAIQQEGATTVDPCNSDDAELIVKYAAWQWRRRDTMEGMPRMLRWMLNNRIMAEKAATDNG